MSFLGVLRLALRSLLRNKLRSFLTMLGVVIGVGAVIAMLAVGQGSRDLVNAQIASLGTNVVIVFPGSQSQGGVRTEAGASTRLTEDDAKAISAQVIEAAEVSPMVRTNSQVKHLGRNWRTSIMGVYPSYLRIRDWELEAGSPFGEAELRGAGKVCLLGRTVADNLFGEGANPIGEDIRIKNIPFRVIGILAAKGQNAMGQDQDDAVIAPFSTVQKRLMGVTNANMILVSAASSDLIDATRDGIKQALSDRRSRQGEDGADFTVRTQTDIGNAADATSKALGVLLASIAGVSLLVGGIGIMNIMLVSVTERTREIGIRMAVGARGRDVLLQFLVEAVVLSLAGGLLGIALGVGISFLVTQIQGWPVTVSPMSIALGFGFSAAVGVFFGWFPARKAAQLNPIDALRFE